MLDALETSLIPFIESVYAAVGYIGLVSVMAIENAFFFLPVPSEVVLPLAGWAVARGTPEPLTGAAWSYWLAVIAAVAGTTLGSLFLYAVSAVGGRPLLERYGRYVLIDRRELDAADRWFARYGDYAVFLARMVPVLRSVISIPAGVARMPLWRFALFSALGTVPWVMLLVWLGVTLGSNWLAVKEFVRPFEYTAYVVIAGAIALFVYRRMRRVRRRPRA